MLVYLYFYLSHHPGTCWLHQLCQDECLHVLSLSVLLLVVKILDLLSFEWYRVLVGLYFYLSHHPGTCWLSPTLPRSVFVFAPQFLHHSRLMAWLAVDNVRSSTVVSWNFWTCILTNVNDKSFNTVFPLVTLHSSGTFLDGNDNKSLPDTEFLALSMGTSLSKKI